DFASYQELSPIVLEDGFDGRRVLARADEIPRRASAEQQTDGFDEDGLARTGFAGEHVEPGVELDLNGINDREMADSKEVEHGKLENSNPNIGLTGISQGDTVLQFVQPGGIPTPEGLRVLKARICCGRPSGAQPLAE